MNTPLTVTYSGTDLQMSQVTDNPQDGAIIELLSDHNPDGTHKAFLVYGGEVETWGTPEDAWAALHQLVWGGGAQPAV